MGALDDVWTLIVLISPGFLAFRIISWLGSYEIKLDHFVVTIYSLICSIIIFIPLSFLYKLESFSDINAHITEPNFVFVSLMLAVIIGAIPGFLIRYIFRKYLRMESAWDGFANAFHRVSVIVYTTDGKEYKGWLKRVSIGKDEKRELCLGEPKLVKRDEEGNSTGVIDIGEEMFFSEANIKRVLRFA